jgi:hypothetical protein
MGMFQPAKGAHLAPQAKCRAVSGVVKRVFIKISFNVEML